MELSNRNTRERINSDAFINDMPSIAPTNSFPEHTSYLFNKRHSSLTDGTNYPNLSRRTQSLTDGTPHPYKACRPLSLFDGTPNQIPTRKPFVKINSASQLEMQSKYGGMDSPVSRVFTSIATGLNRIQSANSMTSLMSPISSDSYVGTSGFVIPMNTIPPRPSTLTAKAELISHLEKIKLKGYNDVIISEVRDGRILDSHIERPIAETISKINMWYSIPNGKTHLQS